MYITCAFGWSDDECNTAIQACDDGVTALCDVNSLCENTGAGTHQCTCNSGWRDNGADVCVDINECRSSECRDDAGACDSECANAATCAESACPSGSVCSSPAVALASFDCSCVTGYSGTLCAVDVDECLTTPCQNSATCTDSTTDVSVAAGWYIQLRLRCGFLGRHVPDRHRRV